MEIVKPCYYDTFRCIASQCPDSCCHEWDVQVDEASAAYYRSLPGQLGDRLREVLQDADGETIMSIVDGRCPMWQQDGLCRIQAELGEQALCEVCRDFPRLRHDYGDFVELGLELSCPEAARLILSDRDARCVSEQISQAGTAEYDEEAMESLKSTREVAMALLSENPPRQALALLLLYGYQAQAELDGEMPEIFDAAGALENARGLKKDGDPAGMLAFFKDLELLTDRWKARLDTPEPTAMCPETLAMARYLVQRYWLQAISDYDLLCRVKFIVIGCILVNVLGGNFRETAQLFSKEIENDADNLDAILDAAYTCPAFTDDKLLGMLL